MELFVIKDRNDSILAISQSSETCCKYVLSKRLSDTSIERITDIELIREIFKRYSEVFLIEVKDKSPIRRRDERIIRSMIKEDDAEIAIALNLFKRIDEYHLSDKERRHLTKAFNLLKKLHSEDLIYRFDISAVDVDSIEFMHMSDAIVELDEYVLSRRGGLI